MTLLEVRCRHPMRSKDGTERKCNHKLGEFKGQANIKCPKCNKITIINTERQQQNAIEPIQSNDD